MRMPIRCGQGISCQSAGYVIGSDVTLNVARRRLFPRRQASHHPQSGRGCFRTNRRSRCPSSRMRFCSTEAAPHLESIREKCLPVDELNAFSHLAIYLRWCIEHDLMSESFCRRWPDIVEAVRTNPAEACLARMGSETSSRANCMLQSSTSAARTLPATTTVPFTSTRRTIRWMSTSMPFPE